MAEDDATKRLSLRDQFQKFGCGCRCLIHLANHRPELTEEEFCHRFYGHFHCPDERYGALCTSALIDIAKEMGLCTHAWTYVDLEYIKKLLKDNDHSGIFVNTVKMRDEAGSLIDKPHWRLVLGYHQDGRWNIWDYIGHPGHEEMEITLSDSELKEEMPHFIVLFQIAPSVLNRKLS